MRFYVCTGWAELDGDVHTCVLLANSAEETEMHVRQYMQQQWPGRRYGLEPCDQIPDEYILRAAAEIAEEAR